jgi:hypothetical protein
MNQRTAQTQGTPVSLRTNGNGPAGPRFLWDGVSRAATVGIFVLGLFAAL